MTDSTSIADQGADALTRIVGFTWDSGPDATPEQCEIMASFNSDRLIACLHRDIHCKLMADDRSPVPLLSNKCKVMFEDIERTALITAWPQERECPPILLAMPSSVRFIYRDTVSECLAMIDEAKRALLDLAFAENQSATKH